MATLFERDTSEPPAVGGSLLTQKWGPMPVWAWGGIGLAAALIYRSWRSNRAAAQQATTSTDLSGTTTPPTVFQDYITITNPIETNPEEPPGQGRPGPPTSVPPRPTPTPRQPAPGRPPRPGAPAPAPSGHWVTVAKWTPRETAWNSTVSGIAKHFGVRTWQQVWNAPQNAALKARRKQPELIQPGDRIFVPA